MSMLKNVHGLDFFSPFKFTNFRNCRNPVQCYKIYVGYILGIGSISFHCHFFVCLPRVDDGLQLKQEAVEAAVGPLVSLLELPSAHPIGRFCTSPLWRYLEKNQTGRNIQAMFTKIHVASNLPWQGQNSLRLLKQWTCPWGFAGVA